MKSKQKIVKHSKRSVTNSALIDSLYNMSLSYKQQQQQQQQQQQNTRITRAKLEKMALENWNLPRATINTKEYQKIIGAVLLRHKQENAKRRISKYKMEQETTHTNQVAMNTVLNYEVDVLKEEVAHLSGQVEQLRDEKSDLNESIED